MNSEETKGLKRGVLIEKAMQDVLKANVSTMVLALEESNHEEFADTVLTEKDILTSIEAKDFTVRMFEGIIDKQIANEAAEAAATNGIIH